VKQPARVSYRQLKLLESEIRIRVDERTRGELIDALADLLLEAVGLMPGESEEAGNESED
jgi:hypothetical protein